MGEFKSWHVFNEEPASKENHRVGGAQCTRAYQSDFCWEKCWRSSLSEDTEKRGLHKFLKFWFQQDRVKATHGRSDLGFGWNSLQEARHFELFSAKKKGGLELATVQPRSQSLGLFSLGYVKDWCYANRPTMNCSAKKYYRYFRLASRGSGHFLVGYGTFGDVWSTLWRGIVVTSKML